MDRETAQAKVLDAAEELFYTRGIQTVGMDQIRNASGVSLKRLYQIFPAKDQLIEAYLERRDSRWRGRLAGHVATHDGAERRLLAVFDWLELWFAEPGFRGCAWINSYGELGAVSEGVRQQTIRHKNAFRKYLDELVADAGLPAELGGHLLLLAEGAMVTAGIFGRTDPARDGRTAAAALIAAARAHQGN